MASAYVDVLVPGHGSAEGAAVATRYRPGLLAVILSWRLVMSCRARRRHTYNES